MAGAAAASQSRLDRLVTLLDSGSTPSIRATAARQLGQIAALRVRGGHYGHSTVASSSSSTAAEGSRNNIKKEEDVSFDEEESFADDNDKASTSQVKTSEVHTINASIASNYRGTDGDWEQAIFLISRVLPHLRSKTWDTRVAAGQAIEAITSACGLWDPDISNNEINGINRNGNEQTTRASQTELLTFSTFSLPQVLETGKKLLSSAGNEYDQPTFASVEERLAHAKRDMQRLGLGSMAGEEIDLGVDVEKELMGDTKPPSPSQGNTDNSNNINSRTSSTLPPPRFATKSNTSMLPPPKFTASPSPSSLMSSSTTKPASPSTSLDRKESFTSISNASARSTPNEETDISKLSARERNQLKRKRKMEEKSSVNSTFGEGNSASKVRVVEGSQVSGSVGDAKTKPSFQQSHGQDTVITPILSTPCTSAEMTPAVDYLSARGNHNAPEVVAPSTPKSGLDMGGSVIIANATSLVAPPNIWPFQLVSALLLSDLFSPKWEVRHGAALGLRELFKTQGYGGGRITETNRKLQNSEIKKREDEGGDLVEMAEKEVSNEEKHTQWCEDAAIRLLCVLSLDRLGDFVFDQVIAPVRETAGQTMASLLKWMPNSSVLSVHNVLLDMVKQDFLLSKSITSQGEAYQLQAKRSVAGYAWEVRHAGLLGLKYEVTIRRDLLLENDEASKTLESVVDLAILCLRDDDDDVRGVAASTLLPVVDEIAEHLPSVISSLMNQLWDCLVHLKDDLSSSTSRVMDLLSKMVESPKVIPHLLDYGISNINSLIPRLFPFFRHTISSVRLAVLRALQAFLKIPQLDQDWIDDRLIRLLYQNLIVEERETIREASKETWQTTMTCLLRQDETKAVPVKLIVNTKSHLENFFTILMTPLGSPINYKLFYVAPSAIATRDSHNVDKGIMAQDLTLVGVDAVIRGRLGAAQALGSIMAHWPDDDHDAHSFFQGILLQYLSSTSALQKCLASVVIQDWIESCLKMKNALPVNEAISTRLISILDSPAPSTYSEMGTMLQRIQSQCVGLYNYFVKEAKVAKAKVPILPSTIDTLGTDSSAFTIDTAKMVMSSGYDKLFDQVPVKMRKEVSLILEDRRRKMIVDVGFYQSIKSKQDTQVGATIAGAAIAMQTLPNKLNPVIRSIMNSVKFEENIDLQKRSAKAVADFVALCSSPTAKANPSEKIIKNLCAFVCQDTTQTPLFDSKQNGIVSLNEASIVVTNGRGGRSVIDKAEAVMTEEVRMGKLIRRGAEFALEAICQRFEKKIFEILPSFWGCMTNPILQIWGSKSEDEEGENGDESLQSNQGQAIVDCCTLLQVVVRYLDPSLQPKILSLIEPLIRSIASPFAIIRSASAKSLAAMADCLTEQVMLAVVEKVLPLLGSATSIAKRQGSIETLSQIINHLDIKLLPYVIVLIVPILGRMSDVDDSIRLVATNSFASLVKMVPLEAGLPDPPGFSQELLHRREDERKFLSQLLDGNKVETYHLPVKINAQLRKYQQDGINWMAFLAKFQLHGILCDDMGLGKTLQSICILASKHYERFQSSSIVEKDKIKR